jgi:hypothetical protein
MNFYLDLFRVYDFNFHIFVRPNFFKDTFGFNYMSKDAFFHLKQQCQATITTIHIINSQT